MRRVSNHNHMDLYAQMAKGVISQDCSVYILNWWDLHEIICSDCFVRKLTYCAYPASYRNCGTWVVFPDPVSPQIIITIFSFIVSMTTCSSDKIGNFSLDSWNIINLYLIQIVQENKFINHMIILESILRRPSNF